MKKILFFITLIFLTCSNLFALPLKEQKLYPINDKSGGGYIDKFGKTVIEQKYNFAQRFVGNYAIVENKNLKKGVIDSFDNVIVDFIYDELDNLSDGFVIYKENGKFGFIDLKNKFKSKPLYDKTKKFSEGMLAVKIGDKWGFVDSKANIIIEPKYYDVGNFSEGLASVSNEKYQTQGYINKKGKTVISFKDNNLEPKEFKEGLAPIIKGEDKSCSYINKKGAIIIDNNKMSPLNAYCGSFYEGLTVFYVDNDPRNILTGFMDKKGKIKYSMLFSVPNSVSEGEFSAFNDFSSGMAQFSLNYKTGYLDKNFRLVIPPVYDFAKDFDGELAYVKFEDKEGYINKSGKWVWSKEREGM